MLSSKPLHGPSSGEMRDVQRRMETGHPPDLVLSVIPLLVIILTRCVRFGEEWSCSETLEEKVG